MDGNESGESVVEYLRRIDGIRRREGVDLDDEDSSVKRISRELMERNFSDEERSFIFQYVQRAYKGTMSDALDGFERAQKRFYLDEERCVISTSAQNLTMKGIKYAEIMQKINPNYDYYSIFNGLQSLKEGLYFVVEFPDNYEEMILWNLSMKEAAEEGNYELAAELRDRMKDISSRV